MEREQPTGPEKQVETSNKRPQMKYFRKVNQNEHLKAWRDRACKPLRVQRVKRSSLIKLYLSNAGGYSGVDKLDSFLVGLLRDQRSTLKILRKIEIRHPCELFFPLVSLVRKGFCRLRQFILAPQWDATDKQAAFIRIIGNNHKQLQQLKIDHLGRRKITDEGIRSLTTQIQKHTNLLRLNLDFEGLKISHEGVRHIGKNLHQLISLNINFYGSYSKDKVLEGLGSQFKSLKNLRNLMLSFTGCDYCLNDQLSILSSHIGNDLSQLRQLSLSFSRCEGIQDLGIEAFANQIGNNPTLVELILSLSQNSEITDVSTQALARLFEEKLHMLQRLELNFYSCEHIRDEGMIALINSIATLQNLRQFCLDFPEGKNLTEKAFPPLMNVNFTQLEKLRLRFLDCTGVTDQFVKDLAIKLGKIPNKLRELILYFDKCSRLEDSGVLALADQVNTLPLLQILYLNFYSVNSLTKKAKNILRIHESNLCKRIGSVTLRLDP